ncbi:DUF4271 domain-containing protein [Flavobacterium sp. 3HN19-14]|uniref:DUF4271 domain-containing protein n=1 Tax=Flavobacterium sp. 3HN19-14 TaxID=3448133 RepID=UPI003EDF0777
MTDILFQARAFAAKDWATVLFVLSFALIALTKNVFESRFSDFTKLAFSDKYIKIYRDSEMMSWFNILLFVVQMLSFAFFIQLLLSYSDKSVVSHYSKTDYILFIRIFTLLGVAVLGKYLIEKIISTAFNIEEFAEQFNLQKVSYRTYSGIILLPINIILFYNDSVSIIVFYIVIVAILITNLLTYLNSLKIYQNLILGKLFYFILYLCALEIGRIISCIIGLQRVSI